MADRVREVTWARSASLALDEAVAYIHQTSPQNAQQVLVAALDAAAGLATLADRGRVVREIDDPTKRELIVLGYRLMYHVEISTVTVVAFVRGSRDFSTWKDELDAAE